MATEKNSQAPARRSLGAGGKDTFFDAMDNHGLALSYDDVLLKTGESKTMPARVSTKTRFSTNIELPIPVVSAAMDTVTEHETAIALALLGGIGVLHKNMSIKQQAKEVARVKHFLHGFVEAPITVSPTDKVGDVLAMREEKQLPFHSFPVVQKNGKVVGIVGSRDFTFCTDKSTQIRTIMSTNFLSAPEVTSLKKAYSLMLKGKKKVLPIVNKQGLLRGLYTFKDAQRIVNDDQSNFTIDENNQLRVAAAVGTGSDTLARVKALKEMGVDAIVLDTAHGDSAPVYAAIKKLRKAFPNIELIAGNVSEPESALRLAQAGAQGIKVGQGPGSICTTRVIAGIGAPQLTAVHKCARAVRGMNVPVCADGGINQTGHIPIAIGAGADCVMLGSLLAGTDESPGEMIHHDGRQWKSYRGMGSLGAMKDNAGSRNRYSQDDASNEKLVPEGIEGLTPYKGPLHAVVHQYIGGLRAGMGYVGAKDIPELHQKARFSRITSAGKKESHPHDVVITKEAPNYNPRRN